MAKEAMRMLIFFTGFLLLLFLFPSCCPLLLSQTISQLMGSKTVSDVQETIKLLSKAKAFQIAGATVRSFAPELLLICA